MTFQLFYGKILQIHRNDGNRVFSIVTFDRIFFHLADIQVFITDIQTDSIDCAYH